jgi:O-antigen/teichoic acid export membrane protein
MGGPLRAAMGAWRRDHLVRNSIYIVLSNATMGLFGFGFWLIGARLFTTTQVGLATTLVTATILIGYASLLGFNSTLVQSLPRSRCQDEEISSAVVLVFPFAALLSLAYLLVLPEFVPAFAFVRSNPLHVAVFVLGTAFAAVNLLTDSVFIAHRAAQFNLIADGLVQSGLRLLLPVTMVSLGAMGIYYATGIASFVAVLVSLWLMRRYFGHRLQLRASWAVLRGFLRSSAANYVANVLTMVPILVLPLVVVHGLGAPSGGYYYISIQIANLLYSVALAVAQSMLAEGSQHGASFGALARRSGLIQLYVLVPGGVLMALLAPFILLIFGRSYSDNGTTALVVFALSAPIVGLNFWTSSLLRLRGQLGALIGSNLVYTVSMCALAALWVDKGLGWVAGAWLLGNLLSGAFGVAALLRYQQPAHHPGEPVTEPVPNSSLQDESPVAVAG